MTSALLHSSPQHHYITLSLPDIIRTTLTYYLLLRDDSQVFTIIPTCLFHHYLSQGDPSRCFNLLPIITRLCLALHMRWSITLTTSNTSHNTCPATYSGTFLLPLLSSLCWSCPVVVTAPCSIVLIFHLALCFTSTISIKRFSFFKSYLYTTKYIIPWLLPRRKITLGNLHKHNSCLI